MFINSLYSYLKKPTRDLDADEPTGLREKMTCIGHCYLTYLLLALSSFIILKILDSAILKHFYEISILSQFELSRQKTFQALGSFSIIIIPFGAPLIEEILFRLPLNLKKTSIGVSIAIIIYRFSGGHLFSFDAYAIYSYVRIVMVLLISFTIVKLVPMSWLEIIKLKYFKHYFYFSAILFGLVHITNLAPFNNCALFLYPLYTLPQFFMGLVIGYLRIRQGFFSGWALHALINLPSALLYYFK